MSFWSSFMPQANDANYNYHFAEIERRKHVADNQVKKSLWEDAEARTPQRLHPGRNAPNRGINAMTKNGNGFHVEGALWLEHRGYASAAGAYQIVPGPKLTTQE